MDGRSPAVMMHELAIINSRLCPLNTLNNQSTTKAPVKILNPIGNPLMPTPTGSWPYTLKAWVGQKRSTEKKLAPEMKVMTSVKVRMRGDCLRRAGNMGYVANFHSQITNAKRRKAPTRIGARTWALRHGYYAYDQRSWHNPEAYRSVLDILPIAAQP